MTETDYTELSELYYQAKRMHLRKFNFKNNFITLDEAKKILKQKG